MISLKCGLSAPKAELLSYLDRLKPCNATFHRSGFDTQPLLNYPAFLNWKTILKKTKQGLKIIKAPAAGTSWQDQLKPYSQAILTVNRSLLVRPPSFSNLDDAFLDDGIQEHLYSSGHLPSPLMGLGFAYNDSHPFICVDLDDLSSENLDIANSLMSFTEVSPSGKGYHVIVQLPSVEEKLQFVNQHEHVNKRNSKASRDLYVNTGFVTLTNNLLPNFPPNIRTITAADLSAIYNTYFSPSPSPVFSVPTPPRPAPEYNQPFAEILGKDGTTIGSAQSPENETQPPPPASHQESSEQTQPPSAQQQQTTKQAKKKLAKLSSGQIKVMLQALPVKQMSNSFLDNCTSGEPIRLDPEAEPEDRDIWLTIAAAIHSWSKGSFEGYHLFNTWSSEGNKYDESACQAVWTSLDTATKQQITVATLVRLYQLATYTFPNKLPSGKPLLNDYENFKAIVAYLGITPKLNIFNKEIIFDLAPTTRTSLSRFEGLDDMSIEGFAECVRSEIARIMFTAPPFSADFIAKALMHMAVGTQYNPVKEFFLDASQRWDGRDRLYELFDTITVAQDFRVFTKAYMVFLRKWLLQVVAGALADKPTILNQVLVFQGVQESGKTMWTRSLMPKELASYCLPDKNLNVRAKGTEYRDQAESLSSVLICNINEIDRLFKKENMADFKAFLDTTEDRVRLAYGRTSVTLQRRTCFLGSTNERFFLADATGNRRFTVMQIEKMRWNHQIDMMQLWGQITQMYLNGETHVLSKESLKDEDQDAIKVRDVVNVDLMTTTDAASLELMYETFDTTCKDHSQYRWLRLGQIASVLGVRIGHGRSQNTKDFKAAVELFLMQIKAPKPAPVAKGARAAIVYAVPPVQEDAITNPFADINENLPLKEHRPPVQ